MTMRLPVLKATVPFYGRQVIDEDVIGIKAQFLLHFESMIQK
jgi:hypothetical protein